MHNEDTKALLRDCRKFIGPMVGTFSGATLLNRIDAALKEEATPPEQMRRRACEAPNESAAKWCSYCKKSDHNDAECWRTRMNPACTGIVLPSGIPASNEFYKRQFDVLREISCEPTLAPTESASPSPSLTAEPSQEGSGASVDAAHTSLRPPPNAHDDCTENGCHSMRVGFKKCDVRCRRVPPVWSGCAQSRCQESMACKWPSDCKSTESAARQVVPSGSADKIVDADAASTGALAVSAAPTVFLTCRRKRMADGELVCLCLPGECPDKVSAAPASQQPTPETDALLFEINEGRVYATVGHVTEKARTLERERNALRLEVAELKARHEVDRETVYRESQRAEAAERDLADLKRGEKELSDSYLRIRKLVNAYNTKPGGADRFEVTERAVSELVALKHTLAKAGEGLPPVPAGRLVDGKVMIWASEYDGLHRIATEQLADAKRCAENSLQSWLLAEKDYQKEIAARDAQIAEINSLSAQRLEMVLERERTIAAKEAEIAEVDAALGNAKAYDDCKNRYEKIRLAMSTAAKANLLGTQLHTANKIILDKGAEIAGLRMQLSESHKDRGAK